MIRASKHTTKFTNDSKITNLESFLQDYKTATQFYVDQLWNNKPTDLNIPRMISTKNLFTQNTILSQRALKCSATQACGIVRGLIEESKKLIWVIEKLKSQGNQDTSKLEKQLEETKISKPILSNDFCCELNSICCDLKFQKNFMFLQLKSIGKEYGKIRIPLKEHRQSLKWKNQGTVLNSFLINKEFVNIRYEIEEKPLKQSGKIVGADQGKLTCLSLSDGQTTKSDKDGWDLTSIIKKLSNKKKGSKGFKKTQDHRKNYINWSINQLNFNEIKQVNLEKLVDVRKGKGTSRNLSHWTYTLIKDKLLRVAQEHEVHVLEQSCIYRSQRCSNCGLVCKSNRKGKLYSCRLCGFMLDSDMNAARNHEVELPFVDDLRFFKLNIRGFYWLRSGLFDLEGEEFTVPCANKG